MNELRDCEALMRGGSKSFFAASRVLPARVRAPATALYAFCRVADDAIDLSDDPARALAGLHARLDAIYADAPHAHPADRAFARVVQRYAIPRVLPDALLEGFEWDAQGRRYATMEALHAYGARVAGTVGAMMALVMQTRDARALGRACELGVAMQLTNIARDVGEDARLGRLYLPLDLLDQAGIDAPSWLARPVFDARIATVVAQVLAEAKRLYARAECGVAALPRDCRPAIQAARLVYAEIGQAVEAAGFDSVSRRAVVPARRKLALMLRASAAALVAPGRAEPVAPIAAVRPLVEAAASDELPARSFYERTVRMLDLFERLEHRRTSALFG